MFISQSALNVRGTRKGKRSGLQSHVNKTTVEIGIRFQMPRGEILVFGCDSVDLQSGG